GNAMRRVLAVTAAVLMLAILAYTGVWFYGAGQLKAAIADWKQESAASGVTVSYDEIRIGGYPLALTAELTGLDLRSEAQRASLQAAPIRLRATPWNPRHIAYDFSGRYGLTISGWRSTHTTVDIESGTGEIRFDGDRREDHGTATNVRMVS